MNSSALSGQLDAGDRVALIAPSSPAAPAVLDAAVRSLEFLGLMPVVMPSCRMRHGYLSGSDSVRAEDINKAFASGNIKGIFCLRGGYGSARLLPLINYDIIRNNPKIFIGYSDITALHAAFNQICELPTLHGPMPGADYTSLDKFSLDSLKNSLFSRKSMTALENPPTLHLKALFPGKASGVLTGGNLTVLASTLGSLYEIDTRNKIVFLEDVNEPLYKIDRALTALELAGKFRDCSGVILGTFTGCENCSPDDSLSFSEIIDEIIFRHRKPVISNLYAGHTYPQITLPLGRPVSISASDDGTCCIKIR